MFHESLENFVGFSADTELRRQCNRTRRATLLNGSVVGNSTSESSGINARVFQNGRCGFASAPETDLAAAERILRQASDNAAFLATRLPRAGEDLAPRVPATYRGTWQEDTVPQKVLLDYLMQIDDYLKNKYPKLVACRVICSCLSLEKELKTSDGVYAYSFLPRSNVIVSVTALTPDGAPVERYEVFGGSGLFGSNFSDPALLYAEIDNVVEQVMRKSEGVFAQAGRKTCIIAPELSGILAHEAVGHTAEADFVISGSVAGPCRGKEVASPIVTLTDFANTYNGVLLPTPIFVDDEGVKAQDAVLIDHGILTGWMHNRASADRYSDPRTGNALAFAFADEPLIRMRNTAILPGTDTLEDMIASVDDGYYFTATGNGQADATGEFMFGVTMGYEIKNGKLGNALRDTTVSGVAFDVLKTVDMISDEMVWLSSGMCGKKQPFPVGMGGPHLKCEINVGGN